MNITAVFGNDLCKASFWLASRFCSNLNNWNWKWIWVYCRYASAGTGYGCMDLKSTKLESRKEYAYKYATLAAGYGFKARRRIKWIIFCSLLISQLHTTTELQN